MINRPSQLWVLWLIEDMLANLQSMVNFASVTHTLSALDRAVLYQELKHCQDVVKEVRNAIPKDQRNVLPAPQARTPHNLDS